MTTVPRPVDVNAAFAAERTAQFAAAQAEQADIDARVAAGTLIPLGNGRYRINDANSLDEGEVLIRRNGQLLPEHGLDTTRGQVALYSAVPAWHALGNIIPGGIADIDKVLELGGIDFDVVRRPVEFRNSLDGPSLVLPEQFVTVRTDTGAGLGVVGGRYEVMQNRGVFEFLQDLVDRYDVIWESAGALRDGRKVFVCLRLPNTIRIDAQGINDQIVPIIAAINSHDGSSLYQVVVTPWRIECGNTERFALRDAHTRWGVRHTRNARDRIEEARRTLGLSMKYYQAFAAEEEALAHTEMTLTEFRTVLDELWEPPAPEAPKRTLTNHGNRTDKLVQLWRANSDRLGRTAYTAERVITEYLDWGRNIRPSKSLRDDLRAARAAPALEGAEDDTKARAHRHLLTLVRR
jgi:phage/plasmid-like protein (TIGR03299 family)